MRRAVAAAGRHLLRVEELISRALLVLLVLLVFVPAVTRTFNRPIIWSIEIAQLLFAWLAFLGANQAMRAGAHIGVDLLTRGLPLRIRTIIALFNLGLIAAFLAALLWYGIELTFVSVDRRFMTTNLSFAFATVAAPLGAALLLLTTAGRVAAVLRHGPEGEEEGGAGGDGGASTGGDTRAGPGDDRRGGAAGGTGEGEGSGRGPDGASGPGRAAAPPGAGAGAPGRGRPEAGGRAPATDGPE